MHKLSTYLAAILATILTACTGRGASPPESDPAASDPVVAEAELQPGDGDVSPEPPQSTPEADSVSATITDTGPIPGGSDVRSERPQSTKPVDPTSTANGHAHSGLTAESHSSSPTRLYMESFGVNGEKVDKRLTWVGPVGPDGLPHGHGSVTTAGVNAGGIKLAPVTWYDVEMDHGNIVKVDYDSRRPNFQN